jgi:asparagine synthase (glutamine-hydrolysing)
VRPIARSDHAARSVIALSFSRAVPREDRDRYRALACAALRVRDDPLPLSAVRTVQVPRALVIVSGHGSAVGHVLPLTRGLGDRRAGAPPAASLDWQEGGVRVATDGLGFKHVYVWKGQDWSAASTSALALAAVTGAVPDEFSWASLGMLGFPLGTSMFASIRLLGPGEVALLSDGGLTVSRRPSEVQRGVSTGAAMLRAVVSEQLERRPDAVLELSGGLDSRLILAAMPPEHRRGRVALTLETGGSDDARLAASLAKRQSLQHVIVPVAWSRHLSRDDVAEGVRRIDAAARCRDYGSNALAAAVLDRVEQHAPPGPRLTGVNGEYARGFYYAGLVPATSINRASTRRLLRWRMLTNERADAALFNVEWYRQQLSALEALLLADLQATGLPLKEATDEFYLHRRVVRWAGPTYSHSSTAQVVLAPFLDARFRSWTSALPVQERAGSRAMARLLCELDPVLAAIPLAGGLSPEAIARRGVGAAMRRATRTGAKVGAKAKQRVRGLGRPSEGSGGPLALLRRAWANDVPGESVAGLSFIDHRRLEELVADPARVDAATASFLVNLDGALRYLRAVRELASSEGGCSVHDLELPGASR